MRRQRLLSSDLRRRHGERDTALDHKSGKYPGESAVRILLGLRLSDTIVAYLLVYAGGESV